MKSVVILTWYFSGTNYGQTLQAFALSRTLKKIGYTPVFQNRYNDYITYYRKMKENPQGLSPDDVRWECLFELYGFEGENACFQRRLKSFDKFVRSNFCLMEFSTRDNDAEWQIRKHRIDIALCGGDQIWNPYCSLTPFFFAYFSNTCNITKISYGPSVGVNFIEKAKKEEVDKFFGYLADFAALSVREVSGASIIRESLARNGYPSKSIEVVLDPVCLIEKKEWENWLNRKQKSRKFKERYILCYFVQECGNRLNVIKEYAKNNELKCHYIGVKKQIIDGNIEDYSYVGPYEFVEEFAGAEYIITDSYHGALFAVIFEKEFVIANRIDVKGNRTINYKNDSRFEDLFKILGIDNRYFNDYEDIAKKQSINYRVVTPRFIREKNRSYSYLLVSMLREETYSLINLWKKEKRPHYKLPDACFIENKNIIIYGAGRVGRDYWIQINEEKICNVVKWVDRKAEELQKKGICVETVYQEYDCINFDIILLAVNDYPVAHDIELFLTGEGVDANKLYWKKPTEVMIND